MTMPRAEYLCWRNMIYRCERPSNHNYQLYGSKGVRVCARWRDSFKNFYADMGSRPSQLHSIDRIDVYGNYEPTNCRWATRTEQANNKRKPSEGELAARAAWRDGVRALLAKRCKAAGGVRAFAREFGSSPQYVSAVLTGKTLPHQRLCKALGIEADGLRWVKAT